MIPGRRRAFENCFQISRSLPSAPVTNEERDGKALDCNFTFPRLLSGLWNLISGCLTVSGSLMTSRWRTAAANPTGQMVTGKMV